MITTDEYQDFLLHEGALTDRIKGTIAKMRGVHHPIDTHGSATQNGSDKESDWQKRHAEREAKLKAAVDRAVANQAARHRMAMA